MEYPIVILIILLVIVCCFIKNKENYKNNTDLYKMITNTNKVQPYEWNQFRNWITYQTYVGGLCNKEILKMWMRYRCRKYFGDKIQCVDAKVYEPEMYVVRFILVDRNRFEFSDGVIVLKTYWKRIGFNNDKQEVWRLNNAILDTNKIYPIWKNQNVSITDLYESKMNNLYDKQGYLRHEPTLPRPSINEYLSLTTKYNPTIPTVHFSKMCNTPDDFSNKNCILTNEYKQRV